MSDAEIRCIHELFCLKTLSDFRQITMCLDVFEAETQLFSLLFVYMIPGTASVALAGLLAAQRAVGKPITEHRVLFLGAGEVS